MGGEGGVSGEGGEGVRSRSGGVEALTTFACKHMQLHRHDDRALTKAAHLSFSSWDSTVVITRSSAIFLSCGGRQTYTTGTKIMAIRMTVMGNVWGKKKRLEI